MENFGDKIIRVHAVLQKSLKYQNTSSVLFFIIINLIVIIFH